MMLGYRAVLCKGKGEVIMKCKLSLVATVSILLMMSGVARAQTYTEQQKNTALQATQETKEQFWNCLANEAEKMLKTNVSFQDFKLYLTGSCLTEKQSFRVPFVDYLAMLYPTMTAQDHFNEFTYVSQSAIDDAVKKFMDRRLGQ